MEALEETSRVGQCCLFAMERRAQLTLPGASSEPRLHVSLCQRVSSHRFGHRKLIRSCRRSGTLLLAVAAQGLPRSPRFRSWMHSWKCERVPPTSSCPPPLVGMIPRPLFVSIACLCPCVRRGLRLVEATEWRRLWESMALVGAETEARGALRAAAEAAWLALASAQVPPPPEP